MNLKPGIVLLTFIGYTYSVIMVGTFCRYKSVKRSFTPNKIVKATNVLECSVRCLSDGQCTRFNFNSRGNLSCEIGLAGNLTCSSLVKKNSWDYYDRDCDIVSIDFYVHRHFFNHLILVQLT